MRLKIGTATTPAASSTTTLTSSLPCASAAIALLRLLRPRIVSALVPGRRGERAGPSRYRLTGVSRRRIRPRVCVSSPASEPSLERPCSAARPHPPASCSPSPAPARSARATAASPC
ncbi:hypothetical protein [Lysobacter gummosus]|uniref:hypothetical protein n=1 Tax=Lysobacter gummosus TaxID=262324 RepID=UPI003636FA2A